MKKTFVILLIALTPWLVRSQIFYCTNCGTASVIGAFQPASSSTWTNPFNWLLSSNSPVNWTLSEPGFSGSNTNIVHATGALSSFINGNWAFNGAGIFTNGTTTQLQISSGSFSGLWGFCPGGFPADPYTVSANLITNNWSTGFGGGVGGNGLVTSYLIVTNSFASTDVFGSWVGVTNSIYTNPPPQFSFYPVQIPVVNANIVNFWPTNGGQVKVHLAGWNKSATNDNVINLFVSGLNVFRSPPTSGNGQKFNLDGTLDYDGTNLTTFFRYLSGDPSSRLASSSMLITNVAVTNLSFSFGLDSDKDTNVVLTEGIVQSSVAISGSAAAVLNLVQIEPFILLPGTVLNSTDTTFGQGAGIIRFDANFIYLSISTNLWKRVALTNW